MSMQEMRRLAGLAPNRTSLTEARFASLSAVARGLVERAPAAKKDWVLEKVSSEPVQRALDRMKDAHKRGGWGQMIKDTGARVKATTDAGKLKGIATAMEVLITSDEEGMTPEQVKQLRALAQQAKAKAGAEGTQREFQMDTPSYRSYGAPDRSMDTEDDDTQVPVTGMEATETYAFNGGMAKPGGDQAVAHPDRSADTEDDTLGLQYQGDEPPMEDIRRMAGIAPRGPSLREAGGASAEAAFHARNDAKSLHKYADNIEHYLKNGQYDQAKKDVEHLIKTFLPTMLKMVNAASE